MVRLVAGVAFKPGLFTTSFGAHVGSLTLGWASGGPPADPWEVLDIDAQHWQLYVPRADSAVRGHDKTGQLCHIPLAFYVEADCLPSLSTPPLQTPPSLKHWQTSLGGYIDPQMQTDSPLLPTSPCPLTTLRNHRPCQVQADLAALCAMVRVSGLLSGI